MDLQVAIFLLIFLSLSCLATLGICYVEIRSCWRQYRLSIETQRLRKLNIIIGDEDAIINVDNVVDKECVLEAALEPATTAILAAAAVGSSENDQYHFSGLENHLNHFDLDIGQYQDLPTVVQPQPPVTSTDYHNNTNASPHNGHDRMIAFHEDVFSANNHHLIYAASHQRFQRDMGAFV